MRLANLRLAIIDLAKAEGWLVLAFATELVSPRSSPGFPNLVLAHPRRGVLFRQVTTDKGPLSSEQIRWLGVLRGSGADADVWRPPDWPTIVATLKGP
jgi:hypothetical protein